MMMMMLTLKGKRLFSIIFVTALLFVFTITTTTTVALSLDLDLVGRAKVHDSNTSKPYMDSRINVHIPFHLHDPDNSWEHVKADFGFGGVSNQGSISAFVYFIDGPNCGPIHLEDANISTTPTVYPTPKHPAEDMLKPPFILLTRGGSCSPVVKVRFGQAIGAAAVVIAHDKCRCSDKICTDKFGPNDCIGSPTFLSNDGSAGDISIPSFLLYKAQAEAIIDQMKNHNQTVLMELTWGLQPLASDAIPSKPVMYHIWASAYDPILDHFNMQQLQSLTKVFKADQALFTPHYPVTDGSRFDCTDTSEVNGPCDHLCANHGRYCTVHAHQLSGHAVLVETVRQLCIWKHYATQVSDFDQFGNAVKGPGDLDVYWDYVIYHRLHCSGPADFANEKCIEEAYKHAKIHTPKLIEDCMADNNLDADMENSILQYEMEQQQEMGVINLPKLTVNKHQLEKTSADHAFLAICEYYWSMSVSTKEYPDICDVCGTCPNVIGCIQQGHCVAFSTHKHDNEASDDKKGGSHKRSSHAGRRWFWTLFILAMIGGGGYYYYVKRMNGEGFSFGSGRNNDRVGLLNSYFQLGGGDS